MEKKKIKIIEANAKTSETIKRLDGFSLRFNIDLCQNSLKHFQNRCISATGEFVGESVNKLNLVSAPVFYLLGLPYTNEITFLTFDHTLLYRLLIRFNLQPGTKSDNALFRWLMILEAIVNTDLQEEWRNALLATKIAEALKISGVNAVLCNTADGYQFYPANAELLDQKLIVDTLNWLSNYPNAKEQYSLALRTHLSGNQVRAVIDSLRLSLELFFKQLPKNDASLENQIKAIGTYLKSYNVSTEIRNMYVKLLDYFTAYNNHNIKHNDQSEFIDNAQVEYLIYLSGIFMRFLSNWKTSIFSWGYYQEVE